MSDGQSEHHARTQRKTDSLMVEFNTSSHGKKHENIENAAQIVKSLLAVLHGREYFSNTTIIEQIHLAVKDMQNRQPKLLKTGYNEGIYEVGDDKFYEHIRRFLKSVYDEKYYVIGDDDVTGFEKLLKKIDTYRGKREALEKRIKTLDANFQ